MATSSNGKSVTTRKPAASSAKKASAAKKPSAAKAAPKASASNEAGTGEDFYIVIGKERHEFSSQISPLYAVKEYYWKGELVNGSSIRFVRGKSKEVPVCKDGNCGYTLVGKAQQFFSASKALCANGEDCDDQEYVYINEHSSLSYVGATGVHTVYVRVYDNIAGNDNDRWVVLYLD